MIEALKKFRRILLRGLRLRPVHKVFRRLKKLGFLCTERVLEVFAWTGEYHTMDYLPYVENLEAWEFQARCEQSLKKNLPGAAIKITDSFSEIKNGDHKYSMIVIDNHQGMFGDDHCEHFDMIGPAMQRLEDKAVIITNVIQHHPFETAGVTKEAYDKHMIRRKQFYGCENPAHISAQFVNNFYAVKAAENGFRLSEVFIVRRNRLVSYLVLCLTKM